ncbi:MAG: ABC transporter permease [Anaerolineae bacterium]|nr:ABC transporter permease [Anaerolineae bacterium]
MNRFVFRRLLQAIPTMFGITMISFLLMLKTPGDPVTLITFRPNNTPETTAIMKRQLGLDQPAHIQYLYWLVGNDWVTIDVDGDGEGDTPGTRKGILRGDLGQSIQQKRPVIDVIGERITATLLLTVPSLLIGYLVGIIIGLLAAIYHGSWLDQLARLLSVIGNAIPSFWLGLIMIIFFSVRLDWLPMSGMRDITKPSSEYQVWDSIPYMVMPVSVFALIIVASISRFTRTQALEVMGQDYVRTAYAKGLKVRGIYLHHIARNALIPIVTLLGGSIGFLLSGAVIIEQVFSWPGLGRTAIDAVSQRDYPVIMGTVIISGVMYIIGLLFSDILYGVVDPRIRLE